MTTRKKKKKCKKKNVTIIIVLVRTAGSGSFVPYCDCGFDCDSSFCPCREADHYRMLSHGDAEVGYLCS